MLQRTLMIVGLVAAFAPAASGAGNPYAGEFNQAGNILISDQFNNRAIEVDPQKHKVWTFGSGNPADCTPGPTTVIAPNDVERLAGGLTLIAGTGTSACPDNRVIVVSEAGNIVFQYGQAGVAGRGPNQLNVPVFALETAKGTFLITDQANARVIEVDQHGKMVYQYAPTGGFALNNPNSAELLPNGDILIADENNSRVFEIDPANGNKVVYYYKGALNIVAFASRLPNGDTLMTDSGNNRILDVNPAKQVIWMYRTNVPGGNANPNPSNAVRLSNGNTLIADQFNNRVIIVDNAKNKVFQYGQTNVAGNGVDQLNAPYNAVVIGDYTGVTPPPPNF